MNARGKRALFLSVYNGIRSNGNGAVEKLAWTYTFFSFTVSYSLGMSSVNTIVCCFGLFIPATSFASI